MMKLETAQSMIREKFLRYSPDRVAGLDPENVRIISQLEDIRKRHLTAALKFLYETQENGLVSKEKLTLAASLSLADLEKEYNVKLMESYSKTLADSFSR